MIDTDFDFRNDTAKGKDPDRHSATLRGHHKFLWSKPLPNGQVFELDDTTPDCYLHHESELGEFFLSSDSLVPTYRGWNRPDLAQILAQMPDADVRSFQGLAYTIGGMLLFPCNQVDGGWTLNQARGMNTATIADRLDLTLSASDARTSDGAAHWTTCSGATTTSSPCSATFASTSTSSSSKT